MAAARPAVIFAPPRRACRQAGKASGAFSHYLRLAIIVTWTTKWSGYYGKYETTNEREPNFIANGLHSRRSSSGRRWSTIVLQRRTRSAGATRTKALESGESG